MNEKIVVVGRSIDEIEELVNFLKEMGKEVETKTKEKEEKYIEVNLRELAKELGQKKIRPNTVEWIEYLISHEWKNIKTRELYRVLLNEGFVVSWSMLSIVIKFLVRKGVFRKERHGVYSLVKKGVVV